MRVERFFNPSQFQECVWPVLLEREAENCLHIGLIGRWVREEIIEVEQTLMLAVLDESSRVQLAAIQSAHRSGVMITRASTEAADKLAEYLHQTAWPGRYVFGPAPMAGELARIYSAYSRRPVALQFRMRVFQLNCVIDPPPVAGAMRKMVATDQELVARWLVEFSRDIGMPRSDDALDGAKKLIEEGAGYLWDIAGQPVAMAAWAGPTPNGVRINCVYAPPDRRGNGYASNLVAALSRVMLDSGKRFCFLFTDLANSTSNNIYRKIGYQPVADHERWEIGSYE